MLQRKNYRIHAGFVRPDSGNMHNRGGEPLAAAVLQLVSKTSAKHTTRLKESYASKITKHDS
jgi:hypothetical protein